jgi:cell division transport system permease protein
MKISSRREEIEILGLLGATKWYIRFPFIIEGMIYGIVSAVIAWGAAYLLLLYSTPFLVSFLTGIPLFPVPVIFMLEIAGGLLALGVIVGGIGSFFAVRHFFQRN